MAPDGMAANIVDGCKALAELSGTTLLGIDLAARADKSTWEFVAASAVPSLLHGGERLADALEALLRGSA